MLIASAGAQAQKIRISAIFVNSEAQAQEILGKLRAGENFGALAAQYSIGPGKDQRGDLGFFDPEDLLAELRDTAQQLEVGQLSGIIAVTNGFCIVMKTDQKTPEALEAMAKQIEQWEFHQDQAAEFYFQNRFGEAARHAREALEIA
ncbi:MAG: peptidylprolyl isomerase, partial [Calditrichaeota bacterium]|nr:peptidylprolyl isomerase [Calditrichota bacterium]MCB0314970.1 peptidylprolyl isomerase [Calditrichota bacterium]